jgi:hypothetical protein
MEGRREISTLQKLRKPMNEFKLEKDINYEHVRSPQGHPFGCRASVRSRLKEIDRQHIEGP